MTPEEIASRNIALTVIIASVAGMIVWCAHWLLTSDHPRAVWLRAVMSRPEVDPTLEESVDAGDRHQAPGVGDTTMKPSIAATDQLTGDLVDSAFAMLPAEAREIVIFEARAQAIADLQRKNLITNLAKVIEAVYHTPRASSSRPESPYQKAKRRVEELVGARPMWVSDLRAKIEDEVEQSKSQ